MAFLRRDFHAASLLHLFSLMAENINVEDWQGVFRTSRTDYVPSEYTASEIGPKGRVAVIC